MKFSLKSSLAMCGRGVSGGCKRDDYFRGVVKGFSCAYCEEELL